MRRPGRPARLGGLLLAGLALAVSSVTVLPANAATPEPSSDLTPTIQTDVTEVTLGERLELTLSGWPQGVVSVSLCGDSAEQGSADCALEASTTITVGEDGTGEGSLFAVAPPTGCPCVVRGTTLVGGTTAVLPVVVPGAEVAPDDESDGDDGGGDAQASPVAAEPAARAVVASAVDPSDSWKDRLLGALGWQRTWTLALTVQNVGDASLPVSDVVVLEGRNELGGEPVATSSPDAVILPGGSTTLTVPVTLEAPVAGRYVLHGVVDPADPGSAFVAEVESWPVLPVALGVFVVAWMVLRGRGGLPWLRAVAVTAVVLGVAVAGHWGAIRWAEDSRAREAQHALLADFAPALGGGEKEGAEQQVVPAGSLTSPATGDLVGVLRLPSLGDDVQLAVVEGVSPEQLGRGPGHYPGTALPGEVGNVVVAGHNARSGAGAPFADLDEVESGDEVVLETSRGTWTYRVTGTRVVPPTEVSVLLPVRDEPGREPMDAQLTLITCDYSQGAETHRLIVEAEITDPVPAGPVVSAEGAS